MESTIKKEQSPLCHEINLQSKVTMPLSRVLVKKSVGSVINEKTILDQLSNPFIINMVSSFQDRQYLYMTMEYLRGGDLRYHLCFYEFFSEEQASISYVIQNLQLGASYWVLNISTPKLSFIGISSLRTQSSKKMAISESLISELPARKKRTILNRLAELQDIWLLKLFAE